MASAPQVSFYKAMIRDDLRKDEGYRKFPYKDTEGKLTIGIGRNLDSVGLRENEIELCFSNDIGDAEIAARALVPEFDRLSDIRKVVVLNMAFQLGHDRLALFTNTLAAINRGDWQAAAEGVLNSRMARQAPVRSAKNAYRMRTDKL